MEVPDGQGGVTGKGKEVVWACTCGPVSQMMSPHRLKVSLPLTEDVTSFRLAYGFCVTLGSS